MDCTAPQERLMETNAREYGPLANYINWIDVRTAQEAETTRTRLLNTPGLITSCLGTKIHHGPLSPGCQRCAGRAWSCLFINGRCNGRCFYCPAPQNHDDPPLSAGIPFHRAKDFAAYVFHFGFKGASISGGEPLLDLDKSLEYISALRAACGPNLHIWLYTNGILATQDKLRRLVAAGLNEIRFDIGATEYDLTQASLAKGIVSTVTVEIPAVPEEESRLIQLLSAMTVAGVAHLNLHQLRLTPHNAHHLLERNYTYVHGPKVTVLESELLALELVARSARDSLPLAVNYCSFAFKHRFQAAASRERFGPWILDDGEELTANGHVRTVRIRNGNDGIERPATLAQLASFPDSTLAHIGYATAFPRQQASPLCPFRQVMVSEEFGIAIERHPLVASMDMNLASLRAATSSPPTSDIFASTLDDSPEWITPGLGPYF